MNRTSALLALSLTACSGTPTEPLPGVAPDGGVAEADGGAPDSGVAERDAGPRDAGPPPFTCLTDYTLASCAAQDALVRMLEALNSLPHLWTGTFRMEETGVYIGIYLDGEAPVRFLVDPIALPDDAMPVPEALARGRAVYLYEDPSGFLDARSGRFTFGPIAGESVLMMRVTSAELAAMRQGNYSLPGLMISEGFRLHQQAEFEPRTGSDRFLPWNEFPMTAAILAHELLLVDALTDLDSARTLDEKREALEGYVAVLDTIAELDTTAGGDALYIIQEAEHWDGSAAFMGYLVQRRLAGASFFAAFGGIEYTIDQDLQAEGLSGLEELLKRVVWTLTGAAALYLTTELGAETYPRLRAGTSPYTMASEFVALDDETRDLRLDALKVRYDYAAKVRLAAEAMAR